MAVKVMVAAAIANRELEPAPTSRRPGEAKPKRRRSAIYDADGNEVLLTLMCLKCHKMRPLSQFGLRRMADGAIRNQPWCRSCRSRAGSPSEAEPAAAPPPPLVSESEPLPAASAERKPLSSASVAAEVAAALAA